MKELRLLRKKRVLLPEDCLLFIKECLLPLKKRFLLAKERLLLHKKRREAAPVRRDIFFAVPLRLENNRPVLRESACATDKEELAMNNLSTLTSQYQQPLLLACGGLLALALLLKCGERKGRLPHLLSLVIVLAAAAVIFLGKDDKAVWIPTLAALLVAAAQEVLKWKPAADSSAAADQTGGMRQYEERLRILEQLVLAKQAATAPDEDEKRMHEAELKALQAKLLARLAATAPDDEQKRLVHKAELKAVQEKLADVEKSWKEEQQRRKAVDKALADMKGQLHDAQIAEAKASLIQGDTKAAEQFFDEAVDKEGKRIALIAYQSGQLAEDRLDYEKAIRQYKKAVTLTEDNPDYLLAAGRVARKLAEYKQAQEWLERLLKMREKERKEDVNIGNVLNELAMLYYAQGGYAEAEPLYKRSLKIRENKLGKYHPDVAESLNNLALLYESQGRYEDAEPLHKRSIEMLEEVFGKEYPHVAAAINNLAALYRMQGRHAEAEPLYKRSIEVREKTLGKHHPDVAESLNNLGRLYYQQGRYAEAELLYQRSFSILMANLPAEYSRISGCQKDYDEMKEKMAGM